MRPWYGSWPPKIRNREEQNDEIEMPRWGGWVILALMVGIIIAVAFLPTRA